MACRLFVDKLLPATMASYCLLNCETISIDVVIRIMKAIYQGAFKWRQKKYRLFRSGLNVLMYVWIHTEYQLVHDYFPNIFCAFCRTIMLTDQMHLTLTLSKYDWLVGLFIFKKHVHKRLKSGNSISLQLEWHPHGTHKSKLVSVLIFLFSNRRVRFINNFPHNSNLMAILT